MAYFVENFYGSKVLVSDEASDSRSVAQYLANGKDYLNDEDPFSIVNLNTLVGKVREWKKCMPRVKPYYAVKCNDDAVVLKTLAQLGVGFDCASKAEIEQAIKLVSPKKIIYAHPCKSANYLSYAKKVGVDLMTFDNEEELEKIKEIHPEARLVLRIYASDPSAQLSLGKKFGCDSFADAPYLLKQAWIMGLSVVGISFHVGSGCNDPTAICNAIQRAKQLFVIGNEIGHKMKILDIGGGFPGNDLACQTPFRKMAEVITVSLNEHFPASDKIEIMAEPGRYFATAIVSTAVQIIAVTKTHAARIIENGDRDEEAFMYYVNDGCFGSFNNVLTDNYTADGKPLFDIVDRNLEEFNSCVWGPTCDGQDQIEIKKMPKMNVGEWLFYENMGAYTKVCSTVFNGFKPGKYFYYIDTENWLQIDTCQIETCNMELAKNNAEAIENFHSHNVEICCN